MDSDLEDSVSLGAVEEEIAPPTSRRRLQRLHRLDDAPARQPDWGGNDQHDESNADYWDEEDEYAEQLHKGTIADDDEDQQSSEGAGVEDEQPAESGAEEGAEEDGFVGGDLHADTQRLLRGQAKYDALGKGFEPVIKPLAGVLSKLKMRAAAVKARSVPQQPPKPSFEAVLAKRLALQDAPVTASADEDLELVSEPSAASLQAGDVSDQDAVSDEAQPTATSPGEDNNSPQGSASEASDGSLASSDGDRRAGDDDGDEDDLASHASPASPGGGISDEALAIANTGERQPGLRVFSRRDGARLGGPCVQPPAEVANSAERTGAMSDDGQEDTGEEDTQPASSGEGAEQEQQASGDEVDAVTRLLQGACNDRQRMSKAAMKRAARFYEMEAELSDEDGEGEAAVVSDDEDEDDEDAGRDLADLIDTNMVPGDMDDAQQKQLHTAWEAEQEASALRRLVQGVKHGFKRIGDDFGDDGDVRLARLRRAAGYEEDGTFNPALLDIDALLGGGGEDGPEDGHEEGAWLRAYKRRKALADLATQRDRDAPPVDEHSQLVAELLQGASNQGGLPRAASGGSSTSAASGRGPAQCQSSFLSRVGSVPKGSGISMANVTAGNSRSYVFGRDEASREGGRQESKGGATSFVGLQGQIEAMSAARRAPSALLGVLQGPSKAETSVQMEGVLKEFSNNVRRV